MSQPPFVNAPSNLKPTSEPMRSPSASCQARGRLLDPLPDKACGLAAPELPAGGATTRIQATSGAADHVSQLQGDGFLAAMRAQVQSNASADPTPPTLPTPLQAIAMGKQLPAPEQVDATSHPKGGLQLTWSPLPNPNTVYVIQRRVADSNGQWQSWSTLCATTGLGRHHDNDLPAGIQQIGYQIQAMHAGKQSPWSMPCTLHIAV